jgi:exodeoxyribonuclease VII large subunit
MLEVATPSVLSVSELNKSIKGLLEGEFSLVWLRGEISNFKAQSSGHFYFSLKDSKSQISAVMFRGHNMQLKFRPEDGMEVLVRARVTVYEPRGNYQILCETLEPVGAGALQKAFEQLKSKLHKEGLFDQARKRPLPVLPKHIGIVTSPTGAAIRDMLNVLSRRFKGVRITLAPCKVQGEGAAGEIGAALQLLSRLPDVDVVIIGRGGGSIEDLWAFNDEKLARLIAASPVPVISAVGHEIDFTISDFVADLRAPTPSAAAELVVKNAADLVSRVSEQQKSLRLALFRYLQFERQQLHSLTKRLVDPQRRLQDAALRSDELSTRLENATMRYLQDQRLNIELLLQKMGTPQNKIDSERQRLAHRNLKLNHSVSAFMIRKKDRWGRLCVQLNAVSPFAVLERGYSFVTASGDGQPAGTILTDVSQITEGMPVQIQFARGLARAQILKIENIKQVKE